MLARTSFAALLAALCATACGDPVAPAARAPAPPSLGDEPLPVPVSSALDVVVEAPLVPLVQTVGVTVDAEATVDLVCDGGDDEMVLHDTSGTEQRRLVLAGLLAGQTYDCTVSSGASASSFQFTTAPLPDDFPVMTVSGVTDGYTIFHQLVWDDKGWNTSLSRLFIVDDEARVRWYLDLGAVGIDLDAHVLDGQRILYGGAIAVPPTIMAPDHDVLLSFDSDERFNHQVEALSDDRILTLTEIDNTNGTNTWTGFEVSIRDLTTQAILWSWSSQTAVDAGQLSISTPDSDPYHANSAQILEGKGEPSLVLVSLRNLDRIIAIDPDSGVIQWTLGRGGDFALVDAAGAPLDDEQWFEDQHALEAHWPRLLLFDNGPLELRSDGTSTRALELSIDEKDRTVTPTWFYADSAAHEALGGDANRLASGNVLMTIPHCLPCNVSDDHSAIVEITPDKNDVWRIDFGSENDLLYRAERVDGCALFSNKRYCPTL